METLEARIYPALFELSQSIAGHSDLDSLCEGLAKALRHVVRFENFALVLYDPEVDGLRLLGWTGTSEAPDMPEMIPVEGSPLGWVYQTQNPLVISDVEQEERWPEFKKKAVCHPIRSVTMVPLTSGEKRLGVLGFGSHEAAELEAGELEFLRRVASELAATVDSVLVNQQLTRERDRLRVLFEITNRLVSKRSPEELFPEVSGQLSRVLRYDVGLITQLTEDKRHLQLYALHFPGEFRAEADHELWPIAGTPAEDALATGLPVVKTRPDFERYTGEVYAKICRYGIRSHCSVPLMAPGGPLGTLDLARLDETPFQENEVALAAQVAGQIALALENSLAFRELESMKDLLAEEKLYLEDEIRANENPGHMIGQSPAFQALQRSLQVVAPTDATVLIQGETGTGKELVARAVHDLSPRRHANFVKVNCAAIPANLLESELFGHEKGAFTGAIAQKTGRFELANRGTLFLDEIGEIPLELQAKLLRAIQEQEFERLGSTRTIRVDSRIIAATNRDLKAMSEAGQFRSDLYYRLHVFPVSMPALRERREDIPLLVKHFTQKFAQRFRRPIEAVPASVMEALERYAWPGNIRELQNVIERSVILSQGNTLRVVLPEIAGTEAAAPAARRRDGGGETVEKERILRVLAECGGQVSGPEGAAAKLGLKRTTLQSRMKKLGIERGYR